MGPVSGLVSTSKKNPWPGAAVGACTCALLAVACSSTRTSAPANDTVSGTVGGVSLTIKDAVGVQGVTMVGFGNGNGGGDGGGSGGGEQAAVAAFLLSDATSGYCGWLQGGNTGWQKSTTVLAAVVAIPGASAVQPGTYTFASMPSGSQPIVQSFFTQFAADCTTNPPKNNKGDEVTGGSITLTDVSGAVLSGSFDLTYPGGHLTGTFDVPVCNVSNLAGLFNNNGSSNNPNGCGG